jgi:hypothetical protein
MADWRSEDFQVPFIGTVRAVKGFDELALELNLEIRQHLNLVAVAQLMKVLSPRVIAVDV